MLQKERPGITYKGDYTGEIKFEWAYVIPDEAPEILSLELMDTDDPGGDFFFLHRTIYDGKQRPVTLSVNKLKDGWIIDDVTVGEYEATGGVQYKNTQYGFDFSLPNSWKEYTIVNSSWKGMSSADEQGEKVIETGTILSIRHPKHCFGSSLSTIFPFVYGTVCII